MKMTLGPILGMALGVVMATVQPGAAAEVKVLTAGAVKQGVLAVGPEFEKSGHKPVVDNDTVGALTKRIEGGEAFDVAVLTPAAVDELTKKGKIADGSKTALARVGVGVMVKAGARCPTSARARRSSARSFRPRRSPNTNRAAGAPAASTTPRRSNSM